MYIDEKFKELMDLAEKFDQVSGELHGLLSEDDECEAIGRFNLYEKVPDVHDFSLFFKQKYKGFPFDYYSKAFRNIRLKVFLRDGEYCVRCGRGPQDDSYLTIDHIKPVSLYPKLSLEMDNMQVLCMECNKEKSNKNCNDYRCKK